MPRATPWNRWPAQRREPIPPLVVASGDSLQPHAPPPAATAALDAPPPAAQDPLRSLPEPIFNTYNTGGYLLWFFPERRVFIDSRQDPDPLELLRDTIDAQRTGKYVALFERHGFTSRPLAKPCSA
jgi:hypothetical protein